MLPEIQNPDSPLLIERNESEKYQKETNHRIEKGELGFRIKNSETAIIDILAENYNQLDRII